ncbi:8-oxoguanine DNA glycosylase OGG fold protein [Streptomyces sp. MN6]
MALTDLSRLPLPPACREALRESRVRRIDDHAVPIAAAWWNAEVAAVRLPGAPVAGSGVTRLRRGDLFEDAAHLPALSDEELLRFAWRVLAWGSGMKLRLNRRRLRAVAHDRARVVKTLRSALAAAPVDAAQAYEVMRPEGRNAVRCLGPAFSTKLLYFAGAGSVRHPCAILDSRVATTLRKTCGWDSLGNGRWPTHTYGRYCTLLARWAAEESERLGRDVGVDEIERWLFDSAGGQAGK